MTSIAIVLMASGFGRRFGGNKLLEEYKGKKLYEYALDSALQSGADYIILVTQYREIYDEVKNKNLPVQCILNAHPENGISQSIKEGLNACRKADGCCFMVCDQPEFKTSTLQMMLKQFRKEPYNILVASDGIKRGNPAIFPAGYYEELMALTGDVGGRQIILRYPEHVREWVTDSLDELKDIDERTDMQRSGL